VGGKRAEVSEAQDDITAGTFWKISQKREIEGTSRGAANFCGGGRTGLSKGGKNP